MMHSSMRHLQNNLERLADTQEKAISQRKHLAPSDDPTQTQVAMGVHAEQTRTNQYERNISDALAWTTTVDTAITSAIDMVQRARVLTVQGANGPLGDESREAIALEVETIRDELMKTANTKLLGRTVFAGTSSTGIAVDPATYQPTPTGAVERRIGDGSTVRVDADAAAVFGTGDDSVFAVLDRIAADLRAGVNVGPRLAEVDDKLNAMLAAQGTTGARQQQIDRAREANLDATVNLETRRSEVEDVDTAQIIMELTAQETVYQASLQILARVGQPSLLNFLS